jgi:hypothetical protein
MTLQTPRVQHRFREVPWSTDLVPYSTTGQRQEGTKRLRLANRRCRFGKRQEICELLPLRRIRRPSPSESTEDQHHATPARDSTNFAPAPARMLRDLVGGLGCRPIWIQLGSCISATLISKLFSVVLKSVVHSFIPGLSALSGCLPVAHPLSTGVVSDHTPI